MEGYNYEREIAKLPQEEQEKTMQLMTSMRREGIQQGLHDGKETLVARQINKRFGSVTSEITERLSALSADDLDNLGEAMFDFSTLADLESWLARKAN
ncbi:MAG: hypothetical protein JWL77_1539 [Chthonomonadaceae bacterium]|nr:hypothetical protein [Chthonomonadaceae bacterium]